MLHHVIARGCRFISNVMRCICLHLRLIKTAAMQDQDEYRKLLGNAMMLKNVHSASVENLFFWTFGRSDRLSIISIVFFSTHNSKLITICLALSAYVFLKMIRKWILKKGDRALSSVQIIVIDCNLSELNYIWKLEC